MGNIRTYLPIGKCFVALNGKTFHSTNMGNKLSSPLDIALYRSRRRVLEGWRDDG